MDNGNANNGDANRRRTSASSGPRDKSISSEGDLTDLLGETRVLLPTSQLLSAFLITVPFSAGFAAIVAAEKYIFLVTFILSVSSLILFSAPAVQHRLASPLRDRVRFKKLANRQILCGSASLACALVLAAQFVLSEVLGHIVATVAAGGMAMLIFVLWWAFPTSWKRRGHL